YLLEQRDIHDYVLLEARPTWGGRIASHSPHGLAALSAALDRFDRGPSLAGDAGPAVATHRDMDGAARQICGRL
ncbi:MAG: hypothetical protein RSB42_06075, partial [Comamonas sp.]